MKKIKTALSHSWQLLFSQKNKASKKSNSKVLEASNVPKKTLWQHFRPLMIALGLLIIANQSVSFIPHYWFAEADYANNDLRTSDSCNTFPSSFYFEQLLRGIKNDPNYTIVFLGDSTVDSHLLKKEDTFKTQMDELIEPLEEEVGPVSVYVLARCKGMSKDFYFMVKKMVEMQVNPDLLIFNIPAYHFHLELKNHTTSEGFNDMVIKSFVNDEEELETMEELGLNTTEIKREVWLENHIPLYAFRADLSAMVFGCHPRDFLYNKVDDSVGCESLPSNEELEYYTYWKDVDELKNKKKAKHPDYVTRDDLFDDKFIFARYYEKLANLVEEENINAMAFTSPINDVFYNGRMLSQVYKDKKQLIKELTLEHGIAYHDFESVLNESNFGDKHHLNSDGTRDFAKIMSKTIVEHVSESENQISPI